VIQNIYIISTYPRLALIVPWIIVRYVSTLRHNYYRRYCIARTQVYSSVFVWSIIRSRIQFAASFLQKKGGDISVRFQGGGDISVVILVSELLGKTTNAASIITSHSIWHTVLAYNGEHPLPWGGSREIRRETRRELRCMYRDSNFRDVIPRLRIYNSGSHLHSLD